MLCFIFRNKTSKCSVNYEVLQNRENVCKKISFKSVVCLQVSFSNKIYSYDPF